MVIVGAERDRDHLVSAYAGVMDALGDCGYLVKEPVFDRALSVASLAEWQQRYREWIGDPVRTRCTAHVRCSISGPSMARAGSGSRSSP